jgi:hypothetical protein
MVVIVDVPWIVPYIKGVVWIPPQEGVIMCEWRKPIVIPTGIDVVPVVWRPSCIPLTPPVTDVRVVVDIPVPRIGEIPIIVIDIYCVGWIFKFGKPLFEGLTGVENNVGFVGVRINVHVAIFVGINTLDNATIDDYPVGFTGFAPQGLHLFFDVCVNYNSGSAAGTLVNCIFERI